MRKTVAKAMAVSLLIFLALGAVIASGAIHPDTNDLMATDIAIIATDVSQNATAVRVNTQIAALQATRQVLPSPTLQTFTPSPPATWTATPGASITPLRTATATRTNTPVPNITHTLTPQRTAPSPTQEDILTPSQVFITAVRTPIPTSTTGAPNVFDRDYICTMRLTSNLTRRLTPFPTSQALGVIPDDSVIAIYPYHGSVPFATGNSWWYVEIPTSAGGGWIAYASVQPPSQATPGTSPIIIERFLIPDPPGSVCIPVLLRS